MRHLAINIIGQRRAARPDLEAGYACIADTEVLACLHFTVYSVQTSANISRHFSVIFLRNAACSIHLRIRSENDNNKNSVGPYEVTKVHSITAAAAECSRGYPYIEIVFNNVVTRTLIWHNARHLCYFVLIITTCT